jgi:hypothetical protein
LAHRTFAAKPTFQTYWIVLDFLGFSRQNRDLSMGYEENSSWSFSRRFRPAAARGATTSVRRRDHAEALDPSSGNSNLISGFLQLIVARAFGRS